MTVSLTHTFVSAVADGGDTSQVRPSNWNAEHTITMATARLLGRTTALAGAVEELTVGTGLTLSGGSLSLDADLQTWAGVTPSANGQTFVAAANYAAMDVLLGHRASDTAANIASAAATINTTNKFLTKQVWDTTNNRLMVATGSNATDPWYIADGSASVTPA